METTRTSVEQEIIQLEREFRATDPRQTTYRYMLMIELSEKYQMLNEIEKTEPKTETHAA